MITWGINSLNHGTSIAVFENHKLISNNFYPVDEITNDMIGQQLPNSIYWYERPWLKKFRQLKAKQYSRAFDLSVLPKNFLRKTKLAGIPINYTAHHASHAAAGYYTSPFNHCAVVVLDAIGEFECASIWEGKHGELRKIWSRSYPHSLGLFYSAFTELCGLEPIKEEYLLQQMSELGNEERYYKDIKEYLGTLINAHKNMHRGILDWPYPINNIIDQQDIAAAVQTVFTEQVDMVMRKAQDLTGSDCLVYMGGCAMNSLTNQKVVVPRFKFRWSLPRPGDPSSSIGAVLYHTKQRVWDYNHGVVKHISISV